MANIKLKRIVETWLARAGFSMPRRFELFHDECFKEIYQQCRDYTLTPVERMYGLYEAVRYVVNRQVEGDFVECGVWKGGSSMVMAETLQRLGIKDRKMYLYDTFSGMSTPTAKDVNLAQNQATSEWEKSQRDDHNEWCYSGLSEVKQNMARTGYPEEETVYVKGKVEETIPKTIPDKIALLRLDTDWYESTKHELEHLFPRLAPQGVLMLDDYGQWQGAREAVDEYLKEHGIKILLNRTDYSGRIAIKTEA